MPSKPKPPPPPPGNRRHVTHGAKAQPPADVIARNVAALTEALAAGAPVRDASGAVPAADQALVVLLARTLARLESVSAWLDENGWQGRGGKPQAALRWESRLSNQAVSYMRELGMTPRSRFQMGRDLAVTVDVAAALSEPDPQRRAQLMQQAGLNSGGGG